VETPDEVKSGVSPLMKNEILKTLSNESLMKEKSAVEADFAFN
jgi:hypothetical protein